MSLDAKRCAELLAIRERATPGPYKAHHYKTMSVIETMHRKGVSIQVHFGTGPALSTFGSKGMAESDAEFLRSVHDLADQLRDALGLLAEAKALVDARDQLGITSMADRRFRRKLTEAGI